MPLPSIVVLTPGDRRDLVPWIAALDGVPGLLIREPNRSPDDVRRLVRVARKVAGTIWLHARTPHDDALLAVVDGVHLPDDPSRRPARAPWGRSCHDVRGVREAWGQGAAWAFLSPIHPPTSKPDDDRPTLGIDVFRSLDGVVYALGGMTPSRHRQARDAGATGSAVLGDLFGLSSPDAAAERLAEWLAQKANSSS